MDEHKGNNCPKCGGVNHPIVLVPIKEGYMKVLPPGASRDFLLIPSLDDRITELTNNQEGEK